MWRRVIRAPEEKPEQGVEEGEGHEAGAWRLLCLPSARQSSWPPILDRRLSIGTDFARARAIPNKCCDRGHEPGGEVPLQPMPRAVSPRQSTRLRRLGRPRRPANFPMPEHGGKGYMAVLLVIGDDGGQAGVNQTRCAFARQAGPAQASRTVSVLPHPALASAAA